MSEPSLDEIRALRESVDRKLLKIELRRPYRSNIPGDTAALWAEDYSAGLDQIARTYLRRTSLANSVQIKRLPLLSVTRSRFVNRVTRVSVSLFNASVNWNYQQWHLPSEFALRDKGVRGQLNLAAKRLVELEAESLFLDVQRLVEDAYRPGLAKQTLMGIVEVPLRNTVRLSAARLNHMVVQMVETYSLVLPLQKMGQKVQLYFWSLTENCPVCKRLADGNPHPASVALQFSPHLCTCAWFVDLTGMNVTEDPWMGS